jgi:hypothetical protein
MYCERFVEFLVDIEAQLPTRRFFNALMDDSHVLSVSLLSNLNQREDGKLFSEVFIHYNMLNFLNRLFQHRILEFSIISFGVSRPIVKVNLPTV